MISLGVPSVVERLHLEDRDVLDVVDALVRELVEQASRTARAASPYR
jgi:hypothetical protein